MTFLRSLAHDLVEKKLWPVAVLLVVALVAVPVVLGGGEEPAPAPVAPVPAGQAAADAAATQARVALAAPATRPVARDGEVRNPFKGPRTQTAKDPVADGVTTDRKAEGEGAGEQAAGKTGGPRGGTPKAGDDAPAPAPGGPKPRVDRTPRRTADPARRPTVDDVRVAVLRFGVAGRERKLRAVPRLAPLPSDAHPVIVFLGVSNDRKTALFMVDAGAKTDGDGTCRPSKDRCKLVRLVKGETQFFDITEEDGSVVQYQLDLAKVRERKTPSRKAATAKRRSGAAAAGVERAASAVELLDLALARVSRTPTP